MSPQISLQTFTLETDVLIIGGGAAGARAAYETSLAGLKTVLAVKGRLGKSGCSIFAGELGYSSPTDRHAAQTGSHARLGDQAMEFYAKYTHYLGDQAYMNSAALYAQDEFLAWIEEQGFYFMRNQENQLVHDKPHQMTVWAARVGSSGLLIMDIMRSLLCRQANVRIFEEATVTRLLKNDGAVVGACLFDYANGHLYIVNAKSVVLATGHSNYLSTRATGTREGAANGWVMAFEAGATLQDIEMQWYHSSDLAHPATWMRLHMYPNPLPDTAHRNRMYNSAGDLFFDSNWYDTNPVPYILQMKYLAKEVIAGRARFDGGYYSSYRHIEPHVIDEYMFQGPFGKKIGVDIKKEMVENAVSWHMNVGGVRVDSSSMETGVPGLLAAGSVSALFTGGIGHVTYDGIIAAKTAIERARTLDKPPSLNNSEVSVEQERIRDLFRSGTTDCWLPGQVKKKIRAVTWEHFNIIKSESSLNKAHEEFCRIEEEVLPRMRTRSDSNRFNYDRVDALDVIDMLAALKLQTKFSLFRKESRGPFYREDFPHTDNVNWLVHVRGHKGDGQAVNLESKAVDLPYAAPREKFSNYFDLDY